jgi:hypothetical protein
VVAISPKFNEILAQSRGEAQQQLWQELVATKSDLVRAERLLLHPDAVDV